jgi:hypothetical protein
MKNLKQTLKENKGRILFLLGINLFILLANLVLWSENTLSIGATIALLSFLTIINLVSILQVYGEYHKIEGFTPAIKHLFSKKK